MKPQIIKVNAYVYPIISFVGYGVDENQFRTFMKKRGCSDEIMDALFVSHVRGKMVVDDKTQAVYVWTPTKDIIALVHELAHTAFYILEICGVVISSENDEAFCYLQQHLLSSVLEV